MTLKFFFLPSLIFASSMVLPATANACGTGGNFFPKKCDPFLPAPKIPLNLHYAAADLPAPAKEELARFRIKEHDEKMPSTASTEPYYEPIDFEKVLKQTGVPALFPALATAGEDSKLPAEKTPHSDLFMSDVEFGGFGGSMKIWTFETVGTISADEFSVRGKVKSERYRAFDNPIVSCVIRDPGKTKSISANSMPQRRVLIEAETIHLSSTGGEPRLIEPNKSESDKVISGEINFSAPAKAKIAGVNVLTLNGSADSSVLKEKRGEISLTVLLRNNDSNAWYFKGWYDSRGKERNFNCKLTSLDDGRIYFLKSPFISGVDVTTEKLIFPGKVEICECDYILDVSPGMYEMQIGLAGTGLWSTQKSKIEVLDAEIDPSVYRK